MRNGYHIQGRLLIGASPRVGVRPLLALDAVVLNVLGVGLFENAAQSGCHEFTTRYYTFVIFSF